MRSEPNLTVDERLFLSSQKIKLAELFDASGMSSSAAKTAMEKAEKLFACGTDPCGNFGHRLRTRSWHCIQCDTAKISFIRRVYKPAYVYIAASIRLQLIKVGSTVDILSRERSFGRQGYGGAFDWNIVCRVWCKHSGRVELDTHTALGAYLVKLPYEKAGKIVEAREMFACGYERAQHALSVYCDEDDWPRRHERRDAFHNYNFPEVITNSKGRSLRALGNLSRDGELVRVLTKDDIDIHLRHLI